MQVTYGHRKEVHMSIENEHPLGAIAFAEARGQKPQEISSVEEIVQKKMEKDEEDLLKALSEHKIDEVSQ